MHTIKNVLVLSTYQDMFASEGFFPVPGLESPSQAGTVITTRVN
jgi:hypothetical protein